MKNSLYVESGRILFQISEPTECNRKYLSNELTHKSFIGIMRFRLLVTG